MPPNEAVPTISKSDEYPKRSRRRRVELTNRRVALGFTQQSLGEALGVTPETIAAWERGAFTPNPDKRPKLARILRMSLPDVDRMIDPDAAPLVLDGHPVPMWLTHYESLVEAAGWLGEVDPVSIPGLLQTPAYAEAVERATEHPFSDEQVEERVERRLARQRALYRVRDALLFTAVVPEHLLRGRVGGHEVMGEQLDHLVEVERLPNVELLVLPADERSTAVVNGFEVLSRPGDTVPFMSVTPDPGGVARYGEDPDVLAKFVTKFEHLISLALPPNDSVELIRDIRETIR
jgi:transcriptional regulator with XRE-family HTH domain